MGPIIQMFIKALQPIVQLVQDVEALAQAHGVTPDELSALYKEAEVLPTPTLEFVSNAIRDTSRPWHKRLNGPNAGQPLTAEELHNAK